MSNETRQPASFATSLRVLLFPNSAEAAAASRTTSLLASIARVAAFTALIVVSAAVGKIMIPGNPVPITLQTFALMITAFMLPTAEATASVTAYVLLGALGLPVFAGGASTMALVGPSAGYIFGFIPAVAITAALVRFAKKLPTIPAVLVGFLSAFLVLSVGLIVVGSFVQSLLTGLPWGHILVVSLPFFIGDSVKSLITALVCLGGVKLASKH